MYKVLPPIGDSSVNSIPPTMNDMLNMGGQDDFLIGKNKILHGGVHLKSTNSNHHVQAIADGKIIAYRLDKTYKKYTPDYKNPSLQLEFSSSFILIEHDFEYVTDLEPNKKLFPKYKFYSLYMHLAPLNDFFENNSIKPNKNIPYPFCMKKNKTILSGIQDKIKIGDKVGVNGSLTFKNGFVDCSLKNGTLDVWLDKKNLRKLKGQNPVSLEIGEILDFLYMKNECHPEKPLPSIIYDDVVDVSSNPIDVKAGEFIGYLGKNIGENTQSVENSIHFEIFTDITNETFLNNSIAMPHFTNEELTNLDNTKSFMAGKMYKHKATQNRLHIFDEFMAIYPSVDVNTGTMLGFNEVSLNPSINVTTGQYNSSQISPTGYPIVTTDMNWLSGNNSWVKLNYLDICDVDYTVDVKKISLLGPDKNKKTVYIKTHSEWAKQNIENRYRVLKKGKKIARGVIIPKLKSTNWENFIKYAQEFCFWEKVGGLPKYDEIICFSPIYFLERLERCFVPLASLNSNDTHKILIHGINNAERLLSKKLYSLEKWRRGGFTPLPSDSIHTDFLNWFGYRKGSTYRNNQRYQVEANGAVVAVQNIPSLRSAVDYVVNLINLQLKFIREELTLLNFMSGLSISNFENTFAFVYKDGVVKKHIFLCFRIFSPDIIYNSNKFNINNIGSRDFSLEAVNTLCHELTHFRDLGGLSDMKIIHNQSHTEIGPYGETDCRDLALQYPSVALRNSDNFSFFIQGATFENKYEFYL